MRRTKSHSKKTRRRASDPHGRLGPDPSTIRNPNARPTSAARRAWVTKDLVPPRIVERPLPRDAGQWGWVADIRGQCFAELGFACWQIWHRCFYLGGRSDRHVKYLEVPLVGAPTREQALEQMATRMVGFGVEYVEVYAVDRFDPSSWTGS